MSFSEKTNVSKQTLPTIRVWIIEDNDLYRKNVISLVSSDIQLSCSGAFQSCEEAIEQLKKGDSPDVLLLDIGLPGMTGVEGITAIKNIAPDIQIIMLTVYDDNENVFNALCSGACGYLLKTSSEEVILNAIKDIVHGGSPMNSSIARRIVETMAIENRCRQHYTLSKREEEILDFVVEGYGNKQIADRLFLSPHTIDTNLRSIYNKLHVHTRSEAVGKVLKDRMI